MFFELEDISRRHSPYFYQSNAGGWHTADDSTPSNNFKRGTFYLKSGVMIGAITATTQQYITHLINNAHLLLKHY